MTNSCSGTVMASKALDRSVRGDDGKVDQTRVRAIEQILNVFDRTETELQRELIRRGAPRYDPKGFSIQVLRSQGVSDIVVLPEVAGTTDEGRVLQQWCAANSIHSLLFISVTDHSRRTRRVLDRALGQHGVRVMVRYTRWSQFDPDSWWQSRNGQRVQITESEKLLVDVLRHPF